MTATYSNLSSWRGPARIAALTAVFTFPWVASAQAQTLDMSAEPTTTTPYALFQYSTLTGLGNTIFAGRVPVTNSSGAVSYYDVTLLFDVASNGTLTLASGYPKITPSQTLITANFQPGRYVGPSNVLGGNAIINVSGPGVASGGATEWSLAAATGANVETYPCSATWYVGTLTSNPLYSRIKAAGITSTAWSYGVIGSASCSSPGNYWDPDTLIGLSQTGNTITVVSFSYAGKDDYGTPKDQITYTLSNQ